MAKQDRTDPVRRGKFVLERILCRGVVPPSPEIVAMFKPLDLSKTAREQFVQHAADPKCASCHQVLDPLGLPFEHYDATGRWVNDDRGMAIDATGSIDGRPFDGVPGLAQLLADMPEARACYVEQWLRFSSGKLLSDADRPNVEWLMTSSRRRPASSTWWWRWCGAKASGTCKLTRRCWPGGRRHEDEEGRGEAGEARAPHPAQAVAPHAAQGRAGRRGRAAVAGADAAARAAVRTR